MRLQRSAHEGGSRCGGGSDPGEGPPDWNENPRSYHLFFLKPDDGQFSYETEIQEPGEDDRVEMFTGRGEIGCSVAVSLVARFALIAPSQMESLESGSSSTPGIDSLIFSLDGERIDPEDHYRELLGEPAWRILEELRGRIAAILEAHAIAVLPEAELQKTVPWLRGGGEALVGTMDEPITVKDAFFFEGI